MKNSNTAFLRLISGIISAFLVLTTSVVYFFSDSKVVAVSISPKQPVYNGNRNSNMVALTFNCYENADIILAIAELLNEYGFSATFFFGGCFIDDKCELLKSLYESGHEIANHGYFHKEHSKLSYEQNLAEIKNTHEIILAQTGIRMNLFAPPSGDFNNSTLQVCQKMGYKVILWSKDTIDWRDKNEKIVYNRATQKVTGGDFVLMHPKMHTLKALPQILNYYIECGLVVTTVTKCMENDG